MSEIHHLPLYQRLIPYLLPSTCSSLSSTCSRLSCRLLLFLHPTATLLLPWNNLFKRIFGSIFGRLRMPFSPWNRPPVTKVPKDETKTLFPVNKWRWICQIPLRNHWDIDVLRPAHKYFPLPDQALALTQEMAGCHFTESEKKKNLYI